MPATELRNFTRRQLVDERVGILAQVRILRHAVQQPEAIPQGDPDDPVELRCRADGLEAYAATIQQEIDSR